MAKGTEQRGRPGDRPNARIDPAVAGDRLAAAPASAASAAPATTAATAVAVQVAPPAASAFVPAGVDPLPDRAGRDPILRWTVHLGLPLGASLLIHASLLAALAFSTWNATSERDFGPGEFEVGIREFNDEMGRSLTWASEGLPTGAVTIPERPLTFDVSDLSDLRAPETLSRLDAGLAGGEGGGFGLGESGLSGVLGVGGGAGEGGGAGFGTGFGSGGGAPLAGVFGLSAAGSRFVYVVDFSGSILVAVDDLKRELKRSVGRLKPTQTFTVILFYSSPRMNRDDFQIEVFSPDLQPARADVKQRFFAWIDTKAPQGSTEPLGAMRRAMRLEPEVIFLFSDGYFDDKVVREIEQTNRSVKARVHTLVFDELLLSDMSGVPRLTEGARRLKRIAEENGGKVKVVSGVDLRGR